MRWPLLVSSLGFFGFGLWAVCAPEAMLGFVDLSALPAAARVDVRAFYGGLELGFGLFLWASARRPTWHEAAHAAAFAIFAGCAITRGLAMAWDQTATYPLVLSGLGEAAGAGLNAWAFGVGRRST